MHSVGPSISLQVVGTLCMQLLLQFYADSFETLQVLGTNNVLFSVLQLLFFSCTKVIVGYLYCLVKDAILLLTLCIWETTK